MFLILEVWWYKGFSYLLLLYYFEIAEPIIIFSSYLSLLFISWSGHYIRALDLTTKCFGDQSCPGTSLTKNFSCKNFNFSLRKLVYIYPNLYILLISSPQNFSHAPTILSGHVKKFWWWIMYLKLLKNKQTYFCKFCAGLVRQTQPVPYIGDILWSNW